MLQKKKITGIVLKGNDYKENAQIIYLLTNTSKMSVLVKGAKNINSHNRALAQPLTMIEIVYTDGALPVLTEGVILNNYNLIKEDLVKMQIAMCLIDKVYHFASAVTDVNKLYDLFTLILEILNTTLHPEELLLIFEVKLCYLLGIGFQFNECVKCNSNNELEGYNIALGGMICKKCHTINEVNIGYETTEMLRLLYFIKIERLDEKFLEFVKPFNIELSSFIDSYYFTYLDYDNRVKKVISKIIH